LTVTLSKIKSSLLVTYTFSRCYYRCSENACVPSSNSAVISNNAHM
jgi:hypothetical protein